MNKLPGFGLVERARALAPLIAREADEIERTRRLTQPVVSALIENGLYRVLLPQSLGGTEAPPEIFMQMLEEVAKADASTAWCLGQCSVCAMTAAYLDADAAREIFGAPARHPRRGAIAHEAQVVPGGYRVTARWDFACGSRQASWLGAHVQVVEADGTPRHSRRRAGNPHHPVSGRERHDVRRLGRDRPQGHRHRLLCGRKSVHPRKIRRIARRPTAVRETGPLYRLATHIVFGLGFAAVSLGVARATLDAAIELARGKASVGIKAMRENNAVQGRSAAPKAICARRAPISMRPPTRLARSRRVTGKYSEAHRAALRLASTWTIHQSASVVDAAYHMAGATAVFSANKFERRFRDMHAIAQQIQARDTHYEDVGRAILATDPATPAMDA